MPKPKRVADRFVFYFGRFKVLKLRRKRLAQIKPLQQGVTTSYRVPGDDPFVRLSDDVITCHILSRLPLAEAVRTSVLSHRWQKLWTGSIGSKLIFLRNRWYGVELFRIGRYLASGINRILELAGLTLDELTVSFDFSSSRYHHTCDSWVEIAFRKGVTRLQLDFSPDLGPTVKRNNYAFPDIDKLSVYWHAVGAGANNLREVCLTSINISGEVLEFLVSNCPSLERLCVSNSHVRRFQKVNISTQSSKLKTLEFVHCHAPVVVISAPNLESLLFIGHASGLRLEHAPLLSELHLGATFCEPFLQSIAPEVRHISELKKLTLDLYPETVKKSIRFPLEFPELVKLEQLEIKFIAHRDTSLLWLLILIKAAPFLQKLSIEMDSFYHTIPNFDSDTENPEEEDGFRENILNTVDQVQLQCVKLIEMRKFKGHSEHLELGQHLLGMAQSLEQLVVAPHKLSRRELKNYRELAKEFHRWLPPTAKLVIL